MTEFFDSHAHLTNDQVFDQAEEILKRAKASHVTKILNICTDQTTLERGLELSKTHPSVLNAAATTPHDVGVEGEPLFPLMEFHAKNGDLAAVGETGLDYHYEHSPRNIQKQFFVKYLHLALETKLPVVIHCRDAFKDFFEIIDSEYRIGGTWAPGVLHCFTGTVEEATQVIDRGWYLSLSGIVTFKKSDLLREVAKIVPLKQLLIETDTPYLAPQKHRGKTNEPAFLPETAELIAAVKNVSLETIAKNTFDNACRFLSLPMPG